MTEENNSEDVQLAENEKRKIKTGQDVNLVITNQTSLDQQQVWDEIRAEIRNRYQALNIPFEAEQITDKKSMEHHIAVLKTLEKGVSEYRQEQKTSGVSLTGAQYGEDKESSGDRPIAQLREISKDIPIDLMQFHSETEMIKFLDAVAHDTNDPRQKEGQKLLAQVLAYTFERTQTVEFQDEAKNFGKKQGKWAKKRQGDD
jgi:hypothetical protein